ncbi:hypothetical protein A33M_1466 [Rhodovulum sp. PH10]|nr:hypothetical protein A33M_1466 [Rhodovulum sp. PH10]
MRNRAGRTCHGTSGPHSPAFGRYWSPRFNRLFPHPCNHRG